ncbi:hypothetical protein Q1695_010523 [Nippostrongylus brasiliensis]|nr:hypothetical protein Q1695_010523 [Nippostrongylus brasiliensis]
MEKSSGVASSQRYAQASIVFIFLPIDAPCGRSAPVVLFLRYPGYTTRILPSLSQFNKESEELDSIFVGVVLLIVSRRLAI